MNRVFVKIILIVSFFDCLSQKSEKAMDNWFWFCCCNGSKKEDTSLAIKKREGGMKNYKNIVRIFKEYDSKCIDSVGSFILNLSNYHNEIFDIFHKRDEPEAKAIQEFYNIYIDKSYPVIRVDQGEFIKISSMNNEKKFSIVNHVNYETDEDFNIFGNFSGKLPMIGYLVNKNWTVKEEKCTGNDILLVLNRSIEKTSTYTLGTRCRI